MLAATVLLTVAGTLGAHLVAAGGGDTSGSEISISSTDTSGSAPCPAVSLPISTPAAAAQQATFTLCGGDPATERAIEQLIAGRPFSATLMARSDGCADLALQLTGVTGTGSQSTSLSVASGGRSVGVQISTQGGVTHASING